MNRTAILTNPTSYVEPIIGDGVNRPRQYRYSVLKASQLLFGTDSRPISLADSIRTRSPVFTWAPANNLVPISAFSRLNMLFFGTPKFAQASLTGKLKEQRFRVLAKRSAKIFAIEPWSANEIAETTDRDVSILPIPIDTDFFRFSDYAGRSGKIMLAGNNGRDEALGDALARLGLPIVRVTSDPVVRDYHQSQPPGGVELVFSVPYNELGDLYRSVSLIIIPLIDFQHAAGMTATFEALACGAPILMSAGRAFTFVEGFETVAGVKDNQPATWLAAIENMLALTASNTGLTRATAERICAAHHPDVIADRIAGELVY
jgi:glycosyltransferase involved in cell wall biosynthesis